MDDPFYAFLEDLNKPETRNPDNEGLMLIQMAMANLSEEPATEVPRRADGTRDFSVRMHGAFRRALSSRSD